MSEGSGAGPGTPDRQKQEEIELLRRIQRRDADAIADLHARYSGPLYALAYQITRGESFAQDVVQDVFVAVWRDAHRFDPARGAVSSWLFALARHKAIDLVRREQNVRKRTVDVDMTLEPAKDDVDAEAWQNIREEAVRDALKELPEAQRTAVELAFFSGLTHVEVAERLEIPLGTAKTRIRTGLIRMRSLLGDRVGETVGST
jgi:RNA polymerase sigma factor (sigma-70 family)